MTNKLTVEQIAKVTHEVNRAFCLSQGDSSQPAWEDAPAWQVASAVSGVQFSIDNPNATADQQHESWLKVKLDDGWKWGPIKDEAKKEHPCFVSYEDLPVAQQAKDHIFKAVVKQLASLEV